MAIKTTVMSNGKKRRRGIKTTGTIGIGSGRAIVGNRDEAKPTTSDCAKDIMFERQLAGQQRQQLKEKRAAYFTRTITYQLWYGDAKMGKPREMLASEAWEKNKALEDKFYRDPSPDARLWRWVDVNTLHIPKGTTLAQVRVLRAKHSYKK